MDIRNAFPSKYVSAVDLAQFKSRSVQLVIARVRFESMKQRGHDQEEDKPVLYFHRAKKGVVLNKTNANALANAFGWETEDWIGKTVELYTAEVEAFGEMVEAIRIRIPKDRPAPARQTRRQTEPMQQEPPLEEVFDDPGPEPEPGELDADGNPF